jgi:hypothetical protein
LSIIFVPWISLRSFLTSIAHKRHSFFPRSFSRLLEVGPSEVQGHSFFRETTTFLPLVFWPRWNSSGLESSNTQSCGVTVLFTQASNCHANLYSCNIFRDSLSKALPARGKLFNLIFCHGNEFVCSILNSWPHCRHHFGLSHQVNCRLPSYKTSSRGSPSLLLSIDHQHQYHQLYRLLFVTALQSSTRPPHILSTSHCVANYSSPTDAWC